MQHDLWPQPDRFTLRSPVSVAGKGSALSAFVATYVTERGQRGEFTRDTRRQAECVLLGFARVVGDPPARELDTEHVLLWMGVVGGRLARSTIRNRLSMLRRFCTWLVKIGEIGANPCDDAPRVRQPRSVPRALPAPSIADLLDVVPDARGEVIALLMAQEGLRCREVAGLQLGDIDPTVRTLIVVGKFGHQRMLPISDETWRAMRRYLLEHPAAAGPLVRSYQYPARGLTAHYVGDLVRRWLAEAGVKQRAYDGVGGHSLRHSAATDVLRASGGDIVLVSRMLGHASVATTQIYIRTYPEDLRAAMTGRTYKRGAPATVTHIEAAAGE